VQKLQVNTTKNNNGNNGKKRKISFITNVLLQHTSIQLFKSRHQINFAVHMSACAC